MFDRREFMKTSSRGLTGAAAGFLIHSSAAGKVAANEKIMIACAGVRGRGRSLSSDFAKLPGSEVAYLCDVDSNVLPPLAKRIESIQGRRPKMVKDLREALDDKSVDAISVSTPDHWHALATLWGCEAGKHVYVEKPVSHNIKEGRRMIEVARKHNRVVQHGTQRRSVPHYKKAIAIVRSGKLGKVHAAKVWNSQLRANIGHKDDGVVPPGVDYNLWLGPAQERPFNANRFHYNWHWHWDYGCGDIGNDGVHDLDIARWGLGVTTPSKVTCSGTKLFFDDDQQTPDTQLATFEFPDSEAMLIYEQKLWSPYPQNGWENGTAFYGTEAYMILGPRGYRIMGRNDKPIEEEQHEFADEPHLQNFIDCIHSGEKPNADVEIGHHSTTLVHLGNIAYRLGRSLDYDGEKEAILGDPMANSYLTRAYRSGFELP